MEGYANSGIQYNNSDKKGRQRIKDCVVVWNHNYIKETEKQLNDTSVYKYVCFNEKLLQGLVGTSNKLFQNLKVKGKISEKRLKYFCINIKKLLSLANSIFYLRYINVWQMFLKSL